MSRIRARRARALDARLHIQNHDLRAWEDSAARIVPHAGNAARDAAQHALISEKEHHTRNPEA